MLDILLDESDVVMLRIDPLVQDVYREAKASEAAGSPSLGAGDLVYVGIARANMDVCSRVFCLENSS